MFKKKKLSIYCCILLFATVFIQITNSSRREDSISIFMRNGDENNFGFLDVNYVNYSDLLDPLFALRLMTNENSPDRVNYSYAIQEQLEEIGIAIDVEIVDWPTFVGELIATRNFDMCIYGLAGSNYDPDMTGVYDEKGSLNLFGYNTSMDWDAGLGTGINEWYMDQGLLIMPPDSEERVQHYWAWEQYLMDKILPTVPLFTPNYYDASWSNLNDYNMTDGLLQSWGKMSWSGLHAGQITSSEVVIVDANWTKLNPLNQSDSSSEFISDACMDPLIKFDANCEAYPHVISDWTHISDTQVRLSIREGIKWQNDSADVFTNEYLDVKDVYFTLYAWKYLSDNTYKWNWLEDMEIIDDYTLDIFIDNDPWTIFYNEPCYHYLKDLEINVLPEHYLNQTQEADGTTPNTTHTSWNTFSTNCFGTGLFEIDSYAQNDETNLTVFEDCWWLDGSITSDPDLDWTNRYGDFTGGLDRLRIRIIDPSQRISEFESGYIDIVSITNFPEERALYEVDPNYNVHSILQLSFKFAGFNMRESRGTPMQSMSLCPHNPSMTIGLAIRKAISYAINRTFINNEFNDCDDKITDYPISPTLGKWLNPDIIKYDCNITKAKEMMFYAGFETGLDSDGDGLTDIIEVEITFTDRLNPDTDGDGLEDGDEVNKYFTNPLVSDANLDSDSDGLTNVEEVDSYSTDPLDSDSDDDTIPDGEEVIAGVDGYVTNPLNDDSDSDGLTDDYEIDTSLTDPTDTDTDGDLMPDGWEVTNNLNPLVDDASGDPDFDDLDNLGEYNNNTDPHDTDTDDDTILDGEEVIEGVDGYVTNPNLADTDGDGFDDAEEINAGTDPTDPNDYPSTPSPSPTETTGIGLIFIPIFFMLFVVFSYLKIKSNKTN